MMLKSCLVAATCSLFLSTSAMAVGWGCTDNTGAYWQFTATSFNNGVATATRNGNGFGVTGSYSEFQSKIHWAMNVGNGNYSCNSTDGNNGSRFWCARTWGNGPDTIQMSNCNPIFFLNDESSEAAPAE